MSSPAAAPMSADALAEHLIRQAAATFDIFAVYLGDQLGFYTALAASGPMTAEALAQACSTNPRSTREWLEQQAVRGFVAVENPQAEAGERRYGLPQAHAEVLADAENLNYLAPIGQLAVGAITPLRQIVEAFRGHGGVPYENYGRDLHEGQGRFNRNMFLHLLGKQWLPAIPAVHRRLQADPPARVADFGCGHGWSSIAIAQSYPKAQVDGFDLDRPSIEAAQGHAQRAGLSGRVRFQVRDAADAALAGQYDLVAAFECIHDMSDPVGALRTMRRLLNPTGYVLVMDENVAERFTTEVSDFEAMLYGCSVVHCLPVGMAAQPSAGTGTIMRPSTMKRYAEDAGFTHFEIAKIDFPFFRFYLMR